MMKEQSVLSLEELKSSLPELLEQTQSALESNVAELNKLFMTLDSPDTRTKQKQIERQSYFLDQKLTNIQRAIIMADSNMYGQCIQCGDSLSVMELAQFPAMVYCCMCHKNVNSTAIRCH